MVNIPKTRRTFCKGKSCRKHTLHKITQYRTGRQRKHTQGRRRSGIKQQRIDGQTLPIFHKKSKTTKKTILRMQCIECQYKNQVTIKRAKFVELGGEKKQRNEIDPW